MIQIPQALIKRDDAGCFIKKTVIVTVEQRLDIRYLFRNTSDLQAPREQEKQRNTLRDVRWQLCTFKKKRTFYHDTRVLYTSKSFKNTNTGPYARTVRTNRFILKLCGRVI